MQDVAQRFLSGVGQNFLDPIRKFGSQIGGGVNIQLTKNRTNEAIKKLQEQQARMIEQQRVVDPRQRKNLQVAVAETQKEIDRNVSEQQGVVKQEVRAPEEVIKAGVGTGATIIGAGLGAGAPAAFGKFAATSGALGGLFGGVSAAVQKKKPSEIIGDAAQSAGEFTGRAPAMFGVARATDPILAGALGKASPPLQKFLSQHGAGGISQQVVRRGLPAVANVAQGAPVNLALGQAPFTPESVAVDAATGALFPGMFSSGKSPFAGKQATGHGLLADLDEASRINDPVAIQDAARKILASDNTPKPDQEYLSVYHKAATEGYKSLDPVEKKLFTSKGIDAVRDAGENVPPGFGKWHDNVLGHPSSGHTSDEMLPELEQYLKSGAVNDPKWNYSLLKTAPEASANGIIASKKVSSAYTGEQDKALKSYASQSDTPPAGLFKSQEQVNPQQPAQGVDFLKPTKGQEQADTAIFGKQTGIEENPNARINDQLPKDINKVLTGAGEVKERGFITSVKEGVNTPQALKDIISGSYVPKSAADLKAQVYQLSQTNPEDLEQLATNPRSDIHIQLGNELLNHYAATGQTAKAKALAEGMAKSGTDLGQAVQAFANYDKTTPGGALKFAQSAVNQFNKTHPDNPLSLDSKAIQKLFDSAKKIQAMPEGRARNIAAHKLMDQVNNLIPSTLVDKAVTLWKAGLLTSLRTHERNIIGNTIHQVAEISKDIPASIADKVMSLRTGKRSLTFTTKGVGSGGKEGVQAGKDIIRTGFDPDEAIDKFDVRHITWGENPVEQRAKKATNIVFRSLGAEDKPFFYAAQKRSLFDQAGAEAINAGKKGDKAFIKSLVDSPTPEMAKTAALEASKATFHDKNIGGRIANSIKKTASGNEITKLLSEAAMPFTGVPTSIAGQMVAYSPAGLIKGIADTGRVLVKDLPRLQRQAAQEVGRGVIGTGLIGIGAWMAGRGYISGQPKDAKEAQQWQLEGKTANSVLYDGKWRSIGSIGPENLLVLAGAKIQQEMAKGEEASVGNYAAGVGKDFLAQTFLQGVQQPLAALTDPARYGTSYVGNQASSVIPNILKDTARAFDSTQRESNTIPDYVKNSVPFLRNKSLPKRDVLGNQLPQEPTGVDAYLDLFNSKTPVKNDVVDELSRLNTAGVNATPSKLAKNQTIHGEKMKLTPEQLDILESKAGPVATEALSALFASEKYQAMNDQDKEAAISSLLSKVRKAVRDTLDLENPDVKLAKPVSPRSASPTTVARPKGLFGGSSGGGLFKKSGGGLFKSKSAGLFK